MTKNPNLTRAMNAFYYKDELYIRLVPSKTMFNSTMVHEVVNRGDVFAMKVSNQQFTVVPGKAVVEHAWLIGQVTKDAELPF